MSNNKIRRLTLTLEVVEQSLNKLFPMAYNDVMQLFYLREVQ